MVALLNYVEKRRCTIDTFPKASGAQNKFVSINYTLRSQMREHLGRSGVVKVVERVPPNERLLSKRVRS